MFDHRHQALEVSIFGTKKFKVSSTFLYKLRQLFGEELQVELRSFITRFLQVCTDIDVSIQRYYSFTNNLSINQKICFILFFIFFFFLDFLPVALVSFDLYPLLGLAERQPAYVNRPIHPRYCYHHYPERYSHPRYQLRSGCRRDHSEICQICIHCITL